MYIYIYLYLYVYIYTYIYIYIYIYIYLSFYLSIYLSIYLSKFICICICIFVYVYSYTYIYIYIYIYREREKRRSAPGRTMVRERSRAVDCWTASYTCLFSSKVNEVMPKYQSVNLSIVRQVVQMGRLLHCVAYLSRFSSSSLLSSQGLNDTQGHVPEIQTLLRTASRRGCWGVGGGVWGLWFGA